MATTTMTAAEPRRFSAAEYHAMSEAGILGYDERTELLDGVIYRMCAIGSNHMRAVNRLNRWAVTGAGDRALVSIQNSVRLSDYTEPEPDVVLLKPSPDDYGSALPGPGDVLLLIEVADSSLAWDRDAKLPRYAEAGIPEVWIVDIGLPRIGVYREPHGSSYRVVTFHTAGDTITPLALPDLVLRCSDVLA
jgi:Uma2 family endonuclease